MKVTHYIVSEKNVHTIIIQNHTHKRAYFKSDDKALVESRFKEIDEDIRNANGKRVDVLVALYYFAKNHGCITVWKAPVTSFTGVLKIVPEGKDTYLLVLARGRQEIILERKDNMTEVRNKYIDLMKKKVNDPTLFTTIWDYAMARQKLEVRDAQ